MGIMWNSKFLFSALCLIGSVCSFAANAQTTTGLSPLFGDCIIRNESGGSGASLMNQFGYVGLYQMGVEYAADNGLCKDKSKIQSGLKNQKWEQCDFATKLAIENGIRNVNDLRYGPNAAKVQQILFQNGSAALWKQIQTDSRTKDFVKDPPLVLNGVTLDANTMVAMAHLKGMGGLIRTLQGEIVADGNGVTPAGYASCVEQCLAGSKEHCNMKAGAKLSVLERVCKATNTPQE